ncbi:hypothetical protein [Azorhizobium doebereinerae]|uniref:hypothetical protein n=1 Tax=Azorhizobium doebereinerae TaxID=281091 RepID=UPI0003FBBAD0|nr:hypothetical protein [Azorhizobium doebereinerae]
MQIGHVDGATRIAGESQGYQGLPIRDEIINCSVGGEGTPAMITAWFPTPDEIARIVAGAPVLSSIIGTTHPPIMLTVGAPPR